jgi:hypothetical protein
MEGATLSDLRAQYFIREREVTVNTSVMVSQLGSTSPTNGITPLMVAVYHAIMTVDSEYYYENEWISVIDSLLKPGIDINCRANDGMTVFDLLNLDPTNFKKLKLSEDDIGFGICTRMQEDLKLGFQKFQYTERKLKSLYEYVESYTPTKKNQLTDAAFNVLQYLIQFDGFIITRYRQPFIEELISSGKKFIGMKPNVHKMVNDLLLHIESTYENEKKDFDSFIDNVGLDNEDDEDEDYTQHRIQKRMDKFRVPASRLDNCRESLLDYCLADADVKYQSILLDNIEKQEARRRQLELSLATCVKEIAAMKEDLNVAKRSRSEAEAEAEAEFESKKSRY